MDLLNDLREDVENGNDLHLLAASDEFLVPMWSYTGEDFSEGVLLEVAGLSSLDDEKAGGDVIDIDLVSSSPDSGAFSDYGSESSAQQNSYMDLSHGSLDLSRTGPYAACQLETLLTTLESAHNTNPPCPTYSTVQSNIPEVSQIQYHAQNRCIDLSRTGNNYLHYSGGTSVSLNQTMNSQSNTLIDLNISEMYYQLPRNKLEPGLGIDQFITYKPETDHNHNEQVPNSISFETASRYQIVDDDDDDDDDSCDNDVSRVTVEHMESNRIPLTVTSQDNDDNDSGTDSIDSNDLEPSPKLNVLVDGTNDENAKSERKRPGRKKGQVSKVYHLWEFMRDALNDPMLCGKVIKWENEEEGIFRVVQSEVVATMWGAKKNNRTKMTYEKMSRSIRYSRKEGYFDDLPKDKGYPKKLCFKFGKKAHNLDFKRHLSSSAISNSRT